MIKVLFVCLGNICRSPMAEGIFNDKIKKLGLENHFRADSAGTSRYHLGDQPDHRTLETLESNGIKHQHAARQATSTDAREFDYILAMDQQNLVDLKKIIPEDDEWLFLIRSFDETSDSLDVPDPYFGGQQGFDRVFDILDKAVDEFIGFLREKHGV